MYDEGWKHDVGLGEGTKGECNGEGACVMGSGGSGVNMECGLKGMGNEGSTRWTGCEMCNTACTATTVHVCSAVGEENGNMEDGVSYKK